MVLVGLLCYLLASIGRAIVRDLHAGAHAQRLMGHVNVVFAVAPAVAPIIGGFLQAAFGWRSVFVLLAELAAAYRKLLTDLVFLAATKTLFTAGA